MATYRRRLAVHAPAALTFERRPYSIVRPTAPATAVHTSSTSLYRCDRFTWANMGNEARPPPPAPPATRSPPQPSPAGLQRASDRMLRGRSMQRPRRPRPPPAAGAVRGASARRQGPCQPAVRPRRARRRRAAPCPRAARARRHRRSSRASPCPRCRTSCSRSPCRRRR